MSTSGPLIFFYDYVDPASFVLKLRLEKAEVGVRESLLPRPFEVNPPPHPLLDPVQGEWHDHWTRTMEEAEDLGVQLARPWIVPWSRKAHELTRHAADHDLFGEIHSALFWAYLIEGKDIGRVDVLVALAEESGLDPVTAKAVLDVDTHREEIEGTRAEGTGMGVVRPPALRLGGKALSGNPAAVELKDLLGLEAERKEP